MHADVPEPFFDLLIIDDIVPCDFSPFRTREYGHYLSFFNSAVLSLEGWHLWLENLSFEDHRASFPVDEPLKARILPFAANRNIGGRLAYITFLSNARRLLPYLRERQLPFILQLYPGGGFEIDQPDTDATLREVLLSPLCRKVITSQAITRDYISSTKIGCPEEKVEFIFGGVFDSDVDFEFARDKVLYGRDKDTVDICFVAHRYGTDVMSKGFDFFVRFASAIAPEVDDARFHVVGGYSPSDVDLGGAAQKITFHGRQPPRFFAEFYPRMDAIVSFNRPFVLAPGAFDGFPTGACLEAGFRGVANIINDPLGLNQEFRDGVDILLLDDDFDRSLERVLALIRDPDKLAALGEGTRRAFRRVIDVNVQLWRRTKIIANELTQHRGLVIVTPASSSALDTWPVQVAAADMRQRIAQLEAENESLRGHVLNLEEKRARLLRNRIKAASRKLRGRDPPA